MLKMACRHFFYSNSWISDTLEKRATYVSPPSPSRHIRLWYIFYFQLLLLNLHMKLSATFTVRFWNLIDPTWVARWRLVTDSPVSCFCENGLLLWFPPSTCGFELCISSLSWSLRQEGVLVCHQNINRLHWS